MAKTDDAKLRPILSSKLFLYVTEFFSGMGVMAAELVAPADRHRVDELPGHRRVSCMPIFVPSLFLLGTVTPGLNKFAADSLENNASVVGRLSACNTVGSILGTFLPTFVTIPAVGTFVTFPIFAGQLLALALVYFLAARAWTGTCGDTPGLGVW